VELARNHFRAHDDRILEEFIRRHHNSIAQNRAPQRAPFLMTTSFQRIDSRTCAPGSICDVLARENIAPLSLKQR